MENCSRSAMTPSSLRLLVEKRSNPPNATRPCASWSWLKRLGRESVPMLLRRPAQHACGRVRGLAAVAGAVAVLAIAAGLWVQNE